MDTSQVEFRDRFLEVIYDSHFVPRGSTWTSKKNMKTNVRNTINTRVLRPVLLVVFTFLLSVTLGNIPFREWTSNTEESNATINEKGETEQRKPENLITWIFEDGTFIPMAKLQGDKAYSIITDHLGTPVESYDEEGKKVWSRELNIYGETRKEFGVENFIPLPLHGQCSTRYYY